MWKFYNFLFNKITAAPDICYDNMLWMHHCATIHNMIINILSDAINNLSVYVFPVTISKHIWQASKTSIKNLLSKNTQTFSRIFFGHSTIFITYVCTTTKLFKKKLFSGNCFLATLLQNWNVNIVSTTNVLVLFDGTRSLKGIILWLWKMKRRSTAITVDCTIFCRYFFRQQIRRLNPREPNLV